ncbi:MAG: 50S ribosomal protein L24 [Gammaproteobacteria bacterium RIFCSPHIGHO2_12_FULL_35_23]|nr:MAG: 50S ribosomal protein L24 [Gammaproteobacteria bacterium RIFCSPHIGHO2_12_FULL_35_23]
MLNKQSLKCKIKQGDEVIIIAGKDKGKQGVVKHVLRKNNSIKLLIEGANLVKKHVKPNPNKNEPGGVVSKEAYLDISNVKIYNSAIGKGDRVGFKFLDDGRKARCFKSTGELINAE